MPKYEVTTSEKGHQRSWPNTEDEDSALSQSRLTMNWKSAPLTNQEEQYSLAITVDYKFGWEGPVVGNRSLKISVTFLLLS